LVEHARNVEGIEDAVHDEYGVAGTSIVSLLSCSLVQSEITIDIKPGSRLARMYGVLRIVERTHCNYGMNPLFASVASRGGLLTSAVDGTGEVRAVERADHPFFIATLYQPQRTSSPDAPHPILTAFVGAVGRSA
jgi:CTP synthase (UTP-ammonia lyase)